MKIRELPISTQTEGGTLGSVPGRPDRLYHRRWRNWKVWAAAVSLSSLLLAGCGDNQPQSNARPENEVVAPSGTAIPLYRDGGAFHDQVGTATRYDLLCFYAKDANDPSAQPYNARAYWVQALDATWTTYMANGDAFVDPQHTGLMPAESSPCPSTTPLPTATPESPS